MCMFFYISYTIKIHYNSSVIAGFAGARSRSATPAVILLVFHPGCTRGSVACAPLSGGRGFWEKGPERRMRMTALDFPFKLFRALVNDGYGLWTLGMCWFECCTVVLPGVYTHSTNANYCCFILFDYNTMNSIAKMHVITTERRSSHCRLQGGHGKGCLL